MTVPPAQNLEVFQQAVRPSDMKRLALLLLMVVSVRAELLPDKSIDQNAPSVSALDAGRFVGREVTVTGHFTCTDFIDHSLKYGLLDGRKRTVFRVLVRIPRIDTDAYLRKLFIGPTFTVRGRIDWDTPFQKDMITGWDWTGGPQIVVTTLDQIRIASPSK
jgi:hypothetical protein